MFQMNRHFCSQHFMWIKMIMLWCLFFSVNSLMISLGPCAMGSEKYPICCWMSSITDNAFTSLKISHPLFLWRFPLVVWVLFLSRNPWLVFLNHHYKERMYPCISKIFQLLFLYSKNYSSKVPHPTPPRNFVFLTLTILFLYSHCWESSEWYIIGKGFCFTSNEDLCFLK